MQRVEGRCATLSEVIISAASGLAILFVCSSDLTSPSEKQVMWFSRELLRQGHRVMVSLGDDPASADSEGDLIPPEAELRWRRFAMRRLSETDLEQARAFQPDLIHAFNCRSPVVAASRAYSDVTGAPVFVHWEDDEWGIMRGLGGSPLRRVLRAARRAIARVHPPAWYLSTKRSISWAVGNAVAFDAVAPAVAKYVEQRTSRKATVILPPLGPLVSPGEAGQALSPERLPRGAVVGYTGDIHPLRIEDLRLAMHAIGTLQRSGYDVGFVHAGGNSAGVDPNALLEDAGMSPESAVFLGHLPFRAVIPLLRRCDVLLQAGYPTRFNLIGLPSKLQAYLASGTPTIVSEAGAGELLEDRAEALKLCRPEPDALADLIKLALDDQGLRRALRQGGPRAAARLFDPRRNTQALVAHYKAHLDTSGKERS